MPAFYRALLANFILCSDSHLTGLLTLAYAREGFTEQKTQQSLAWANDLFRLRISLLELHRRRPEAGSWLVLLEFEIPRKTRRIDVVLLARDQIILLEQKTHLPTKDDCLQAEEYALLLHYFHEPSNHRPIVPLVVSATEGQVHERGSQQELPFLETAAYWIRPVKSVSWNDLAGHIASLPSYAGQAIDPEAWENGAYRPVPTIIEAARCLQSGLKVAEIAHSKAAEHEVDGLTAFVQQKVREAKQKQQFVICFVTGVPGSGKTLVGLNLAFSKEAGTEPIHFMSGNGTLVKVLQTVLTRHHQQRNKVRALEAKIHARTLIENVHVFAQTYTDKDKERPPSNHVVIFDEAQRAWNKAQNFAKFKRDYSEPEMLLRIMERHADWAVVIALVGGGQEINSGEAGLGEWGRALAGAAKTWIACASGEAVEGGASVAGNKLGANSEVERVDQLHLDVSLRSLNAGTYASWVNHVVNGEQAQAADLVGQTEFPIYLTRQLHLLRGALRRESRGLSRAGLVGSSQAARLRAEGLEPDSSFHAGYPWEHWYLAGLGDVRASHQLEVFATEFEIQGLELDWVGLCWGGDFIWSQKRGEWLIRSFRAGSSKWSEMKSADRRLYRRNSYRVLLTRARQGIVLYVPAGDEQDATRSPEEFDETAAFLLSCGARAVETDAADTVMADLSKS